MKNFTDKNANAGRSGIPQRPFLELENRYKEDLRAEIKKYRKTISEQDTMNRNLVVIFILAIVLAGVYIGNLKKTIHRQSSQIQMYKLFYDEVKGSETYRIMEMCKDAGTWQAECIAWELNNGKGKRK